ncbi:hypothetical protein LEP1GSC161_1308 [Leptospira santarosai str. CBC1416]|uniref:Uncharacterized protein n=1 Tax=Leptospira santarosai str. CBC1416 TaxID=1193059 RepID=M6VMA7_9LEPT|nr:hypothetical protein LEP1GSC161_1308 [Leptospira santarosai str. CBC1416]
MIQEILKYFGKDRTLLRKTILNFSFEGKKTKNGTEESKPAQHIRIFLCSRRTCI